MHDIEIEAFIPVFMNSCRRVSSHRDFVDMDETEITYCMADQDVIEACKITMNVDGTKRSTASVILTLSAAKMPGRVHIGYESVSARPYIPNPFGCFNCQLYGHHGNVSWSSNAYCGKCLEEGHSVDQCTSLVQKCRNCANSTFSRDWPAWKIEKEICTVKATEGDFLL